MEFKDILKEKRKKIGLSQAQLEVKLNLNRGNISKYENGETKPTVETLIKLAELFNCSADELLGINTIEVKNQNNDVIKIGSNDINLNELEKLTIGDINKLIDYIKSMGIDTNR